MLSSLPTVLLSGIACEAKELSHSNATLVVASRRLCGPREVVGDRGQRLSPVAYCIIELLLKSIRM